MYPRRAPAGFGNPDTNDSARQPRAKPLKRPRQARAKFTVQAIFDAFVRIWRDSGWDNLTTRAVALETGISIGTLYEYFPGKQALLSGYFRHCVETLMAQIDAQVIAPPELDWKERTHRLVALTCSKQAAELPYFDAGMLQLETQIAELKHHVRVYEELSAKWIAAFDICRDLPHKPDAEVVRALFTAAWGARRYLLLINADEATAARFVAEMERMCHGRLLQSDPPHAGGT